MFIFCCYTGLAYSEMANLKTKDLVLVGNIELHLKNSDWIFHKHSENPAYENIILHVVFLDDVEIVLKSLVEGKIKQYQKSQSKTRSALIGKKHIRMFFRKEDENSIKILLFFDLRQNPKKILDLLK